MSNHYFLSSTRQIQQCPMKTLRLICPIPNLSRFLHPLHLLLLFLYLFTYLRFQRNISNALYIQLIYLATFPTLYKKQIAWTQFPWYADQGQFIQFSHAGFQPQEALSGEMTMRQSLFMPFKPNEIA